MKKMLIISSGAPFVGGEATTAYNLLKLLNNKYRVRLVYFNSTQSANVDPDSTGLSVKISIFKPLRFFGGVLKKTKSTNVSSESNNNSGSNFTKRLYDFLLMLSLGFYLVKNWFPPRLVIVFNIHDFKRVNRLFAPKNILLVIGGCHEMIAFANSNTDTCSLLNNHESLSEVKGYDTRIDYNANVIFNSDLTRRLYVLLAYKMKEPKVQFFNLIPENISASKDFDSRKYDLIFISSDFNRSVKNAKLAFDIFSYFKDKKKIAIGIASSNWNNIENTELKNIESQANIMAYLCNAKLLVISSYFDSSPGIMSEAIMCGCNILISKNVGWHEMVDERCVVNDYYNFDEWLDKASFLVHHKIENPDFMKVIANSKNEISGCIDNYVLQTH